MIVALYQAYNYDIEWVSIDGSQGGQIGSCVGLPPM